MDAKYLENGNKSQFLIAWYGLVIVLISTSVLIGAWQNITLFLSVLAPWVSIKINAAICFFLAGVLLFYLSSNYRGLITNSVFFVIIGLIVIISGLSLIEYIIGVDLGLDQLTLKWIPSGYNHGRMPLVTAINFLLMALSFVLLLKKTKLIWFASVLAWLMLILSLMSVFNYFYAMDHSSVYVTYTTMSMQSMFLFLLISISIFLLKPNSKTSDLLLGQSGGDYVAYKTMAVLIVFPMIIVQAGFYLQSSRLMDSLGFLVIIQIVCFTVIGIVLALSIVRIGYKERELKRAQVQIRHNEMLFHRFAENIDVVFFTTTADFSQVLYVSPAYEKIWGRSCESLYKDPRGWYDAILPKDKKKAYKTFFVGFPKARASRSLEFGIKRPDGGLRNIYSKIYKVPDDLNHIIVAVGIAVDITQITQEKTHKELQYDVLTLMEKESNFKEFFHKLLEKMSKTLCFELSELWLIDETDKVLRSVDVWHREDKRLDTFAKTSSEYTFKLGEGLLGRVWEKQTSFFTCDYSKNLFDPRFGDATKAGVHCVFAVPIIYQNKIFGILDFFSYDMGKPDRALTMLMQNMGRSIGEFIVRVKALEAIEKVSQYDLLTGLLNRSKLEQKLDGLIVDKKYKSIAIMVIDLDRFKLINDTLGNDFGDKLLKVVGARIIEPIEDTSVHAARFGGDQFILYLIGVDGQKTADYAQALQHRFRDVFELAGEKIKLSASIGVSQYPKDGLDSKSLIINADLALAQAKNMGGNRIYFFTSDLPVFLSEKITLDADLRQALLNPKQFILEYQPQVDIKTGKICAAEALVRWQHPTKGLISPMEFIPFAEKNNLIIPLNETLLRLVFQQLSVDRLDIPVSVNISAQQFEDGFHLLEFFESLLMEFSIKSKQIELEITENILVENTAHTISILKAIQELGFKIAIDDFGTGFSSLGYLNRLPVWKIKIDKSFISGIPTNLENVNIVKTILQLSHSLGKIVIAEGAETKKEVDFLKQEGCDMIQGFYYYKPMSYDTLKLAIAKNKKTKKQ